VRDLIKLALTDPKAVLRAIKRVPVSQAGLAFVPDGRGDGRPTAAAANPLREYFEAHAEGHGIWKFDHYLDVYHRHLGKLVGRPITFLEIGVYSGGSLDMWCEYFGPQATIWGVDIEPDCAAYATGQIEVFIGSQDDPSFLASIHRGEGIDAALDDGSHECAHQIVSFEHLFPRLNPGGIYICEDVHGIHNPFLDYIHGLNRSLSAMLPTDNGLAIPANGFQRWVQSIHLYPYSVVIEKRNQPADVITAQRKGSSWRPFPVKK